MAEPRGRAAAKQSAKQPARRREPPSRRRAAERLAAAPKLPLARRNWTVMGVGLVAIAVGFFALSRGSITLAPILLVLGYCVLIPVGILLPPVKPASEEPAGKAAAGE